MRFKKVASIFLLTVACVIPSRAEAVFNIAVRPYQGGNDLRFGTVNSFGPYESGELLIEIISDTGSQYQVVQTLLDPLTNARGNMIPQDSFYFYGIRGSNQLGTLLVQQETPVMSGRRVVYTSNQTGNTDSLKLVYLIKPPLNVPSGSYRGRMAFILEPIGGPGSPMTVVINMFAEVSAESGFNIRTTRGSKMVSLYTSRPEGYSDTVLIEIKGGLGTPYRIYQELTQPLEASNANRLSRSALIFDVTETTEGSGVTREPLAPSQRQLVYTSDAQGSPDTFLVTYTLVAPEEEEAGRYRSGIRYSVTSQDMQEALDTLTLEVEVDPIFELSITPETGGIIEFRNLKPGDKPQRVEVVMGVKNNTGREYQVSQNIASGLASKEGKLVPEKFFTLLEEPIDTKGTLFFTSAAEVKKGETVLLRSDDKGSSDSFKVIYALDPSFEIEAGNYGARITYSITEL